MLTIVEGRVLGCLMEKERTVPDQYPLTMNALLSACNQSTSRDPVMRLDEHEILNAITSMKAAGLARLVHPSHGRSATRYRHVADEQFGLEPGPAALMAVMLLRGPQTLSELRTRSERQHGFTSFDEVEATLRELADRGLVQQLERQPGQKETRWQQLIAEEAAPSAPPAFRPAADWAAAQPATAVAVAPPPEDPDLAARVEELEARVAKLEAALADLL